MPSESTKQTALDDTPIESFVIVARAVRPKGLKGEVVAELLTDFPERFKQIDQFFAISPRGERIAVKLERFSFQKDRVVFKLAGFDSVESAGTLVGYEFVVPESERVELGEDEFYDWELEGCRVETVSGQMIGTVTGVLRTGAANLLVVKDENRPEVLIPMVASILTGIDREEKLIKIDPPEGLLEL
ncbi:MAG: rRNA processing protein RimM [Acidobacteria bacterium]|nr:rRNA processing protein RimM [Acidobacteriota bacterium]